MNIEVAIYIDGTPIQPNSDLQGLLQNLVASYIKQKFLLAAPVKEKKVKAPRDPNAPVKHHKITRWTAEELSSLRDDALRLHAQGMSVRQLVAQISVDYDRTYSSIQNKVHIMRKSGEIPIPISPENQLTGKAIPPPQNI